ncbi:hypothetical protein A2U01_0060573, partial [Trifolium medium]|nr:hypothetical protein [Trifolium medium]
VMIRCLRSVVEDAAAIGE